MLLPTPRGPLTAALHDAGPVPAVPPAPADPCADDELQLALWTCYELHYRGFDDVDDRWEWEPALIRFRRGLEEILLAALRRGVTVPDASDDVPGRLQQLIDADDGPSVSLFVHRQADRRQVREWAVHRSLYQLKESDPHTWALPRLSGRTKAAMVQIQTDEYGNGRTARMHQELYRVTLRGMGLSDAYGAYVDAVPGVTLMLSNVMSLFGLRRSLRGALVGHLTAYEMTSSEPCRRYAMGLRRLGHDRATCDFYDEHVTADALHEQLAAHDLCGALAADEPELAPDILFGAAACIHAERRFGEWMTRCWDAGVTTLRDPAAVAGDLPRAS